MAPKSDHPLDADQTGESQTPEPERAVVEATQPQPVSHVHLSLDLAEGMRVRITVEALPASGVEAGPQPIKTVFETQAGRAGKSPIMVSLPVYPPGLPASGALSPAARWAGVAPRLASLWATWKALPFSLEIALFSLAVCIYLVTRLVGLVHFPIYFFTDEAVQTVLAGDLVRDHFKNYAGEFLPTFFENGGKYRLGVTVYLQVLPYLLFGKSVFVTRATSALLTLAAAIAVGLILRNIFKLSYWWSGVLFLSITPTWFLHSRTAFEYPAGVAFYALFLYFYLLYRHREPRHLYMALISGALAFYSYSPFQVIVPASGVLLAISDWRYHWQNRRVGLMGVGLVILLAIPYLRFLLVHGRGNYESLSALGSYWIKPISFWQKLRLYFAEYLHGLSPMYWFNPKTGELIRHLMKGYGHLIPVTLPFVLLGFALAIKKVRSSEYRAVLIAMLVAPSGAALVQLGVTRALVLVIPAAIFTAFGMEQVLIWLEKAGAPRNALAITLFVLLSIVNLGMLRDALVNGPTWYDNYGMSGMQYGAVEVFPVVKQILKEQPETRIIFSPDWANGTDVVARFFFPDPLPFQMGSVDGHIVQRLPLDDKTLFILTPEEYEKVIASPKITDIRIERMLPYPNGKPGFYFVRLRYVNNIDEILAQDKAARRVLQEAQIFIDNQPVTARYSLLDMGQIVNIWDKNPDTAARTFEADPFVLELVFPASRLLKGLSIQIGSTRARITACLYSEEGANPVVYQGVFDGSVQNPIAVMDFPAPTSTKILHLEVDDLHQTEPGHVHIWEITLR